MYLLLYHYTYFFLVVTVHVCLYTYLCASEWQFTQCCLEFNSMFPVQFYVLSFAFNAHFQVLQPVVRAVANNFITERNSGDAIAMGYVW